MANLCGVLVKALNFDLDVSEFKHQEFYCVHFQNRVLSYLVFAQIGTDSYKRSPDNSLNV